MKARRLIVSLVLLALISNAGVFAKTGAADTTNLEGQAFTLVSLKHETSGALTRILIESSSPPLYTVFRPSDKLLVIDLPGGEASALASQYAIKSALVEAITVRQSKVGGSSSRLVARIEVAVRGDVRDRSSISGNTLVIELSPASASTGAAKAADAKPVNQPRAGSDKAESPSAGVQVYPVAKVTRTAADRTGARPAESGLPQPKMDRAPAPSNNLKPATLVRAVRSEVVEGGVRIFIDADGAAQFKDFVLPDPWRVVVDISGVRSAFGNRTSAVGASMVDRVRVGQPSDNTVRIVVDMKSKVPHRVVRDGQSLIIMVGSVSAPRSESSGSVAEVKASAQPQTRNTSPEVKVAGQRVEKESASATTQPDAQAGKQSTVPPSNLVAQSSRPSGGQMPPPRVTPQPNRSLPLPNQPAAGSSNSVRETVTHTAQPSVNRGATDPRVTSSYPSNPAPAPQRPAEQRPAEQRPEQQAVALCEQGYTGGLISFDLRAGVDLRDMLRFVSTQYGVNFVFDSAVGKVPVDIRVTDVPWNQVLEAVLRANKLGALCESGGRIIRITTLTAIKEQRDQQRLAEEARVLSVPTETKIVRLKYARVSGALGATGNGRSGGAGSLGWGNAYGGGTGANKAAGAGGGGGLLEIIKRRLSQRGTIEIDQRTNSLIITDIPEYLMAAENIISQLDKPDPQVEIEARIVIASRNFLRDIGNELGAATINSRNGATGFLQTTPLQLVGRGLSPGGEDAGGSGGGGGSGGAGGDSEKQKGLGQNLVGPFADKALRAGVANTVLSLTTGMIGTSIISAALSASETKGHIRTIASPRITASNNQTAEIVNGVQIPVQTVSNNTITTTFVTAALRLEITPQIIEDTGEVLMHVVAENNRVNFGLANQFNNGTPGIDTQSADSTVRVQDGGTTVMGGINIDSESHSVNRTPGVASIPVLGNLFKRKTTRRDSDEILFFITPRIVRNDGLIVPHQRSSVEGMPNTAGPQRAATPAATQQANAAAKNAAGKGGQ